jgi:ribonuclease-3
MDVSKYQDFAKDKFGDFKDIKLLITAFTHRSAAARENFEPLLRLSRGEKRGSERARQQILANCYEAVVGALYLEKGYEAAQKFIESTLLSTFAEILSSGSWLDPKSRLQEVVQNKEGFTPVYKVLSEEGRGDRA